METFNRIHPHILNELEQSGWALTPKLLPLHWQTDALAAGWPVFPLAAEVLGLFDGFGTETEEEIYVGAWRAISKPDNHSELTQARKKWLLFPIDLAAGWVNILLRDDACVYLVINGKLAPYSPTNSLSDLLGNILHIRRTQHDS